MVGRAARLRPTYPGGVDTGVPWPGTVVDDVGPGCEQVVDGFLREPVSAWSSLAFVLAGVLIEVLARRRRRAGERDPDGPLGGVVEPPSLTYALLVAGIGVGSVVQHGPNPAWADLAHDLPLLATLALIVADAVADLAGRHRQWWWWALPTALLAPVIHWLPDQGDMSQGVVATMAVLVNLERARRRPALRRPIGWTVVLLGVGGVLQLASRPGRPLCFPDSSWWFPHAIWHVLVAAALTILAGGLGLRHAPRVGPTVSTAAGPAPSPSPGRVGAGRRHRR